MIINSLSIIIEAEDVQGLIAKMAGEVDKLKDLTVALENGRVILSGRISVGLTIPFSARWQARVINEGSAARLTLVGVSVGIPGMGEEMIAHQVLKLLESKLQGHESVRLEGSEIIADLKPALAARGILLNAPLKRLEITASGIILEA